MRTVDFTFTDANGRRVGDWQADNTMAAYDQANRRAQQLANQLQTAIAVTAWLEDREGATTIRYPKKRGRPAKPDALSNAARQAAYRERKKAQGICPCCGQALP